jgi:hypothetical protein
MRYQSKGIGFHSNGKTLISGRLSLAILIGRQQTLHLAIVRQTQAGKNTLDTCAAWDIGQTGLRISWRQNQIVLMLGNDLKTKHQLAQLKFIISCICDDEAFINPYHGNLGQAEDTTDILALSTGIILYGQVQFVKRFFDRLNFLSNNICNRC